MEEKYEEKTIRKRKKKETERLGRNGRSVESRVLWPIRNLQIRNFDSTIKQDKTHDN